jgi:xylulokinase
VSATQAFVGIDAGTTGCTVMVFDEQGNRLGEGYHEYPCSSPRAGWIEQDVRDVWRGICEASKQAVAAAGVPDDAYKSVGFSSQRGTFIMLDEDKAPIANSIVWNDGRALKYQDEFAKTISADDYHTHTGMQLSPLWSAAKIAWLRDEDPTLFERTRWFANGQEYFLHRMGAEEWVTDPASLTLNGMLDIEKLDWSDQVLELCGIDREKVPPVGIPSGQAGHVSPAASYATGIPVGVPLCRGAGDQQCAAIGAGVVQQGMAEFTVGTAGVMVAHLDGLDRIQGRNLWWGGHAVPGAWDIEGGAFALGSSLKWWRDHLGMEEAVEAEKSGRNIYSVMVDKAGTAPPGSNGLLFHSFLASQVTPYYDAASRGAWIGLGLYHTRADMLRALLEGCAFEMRMVVDAFQSDIKGGIDDLRLTGGGTKSDGFAQQMTDIIGQPTKVTRERECTVLGAAILGAFGAGAFGSIDEAVGAMVNVEGEFEPATETKELYDEQYRIYRGMYEAIAEKGQYAALSDFSSKHF